MRRALAIAALTWAFGAPACAQCDPEPDPPANMRTVARRHYTDGVEAATAERWGEAREAFQRAYDVAPFAQVVFNLATAQARTGLLVESAENYRRFLRRCASESMEDLRAQAHDLLGQVSPRIARLTLRVHHLHERDTVRVDDIEVPRAIVGTEIPVNPGSHEVVVERGEQGRVLQRTVEVGEGQSTTLELAVPQYVAPDDGGGDGGGGDDAGVIVGVSIAAAVLLGAGAAVLAFFATQDQGEGLPAGTWAPASVPLVRF